MTQKYTPTTTTVIVINRPTITMVTVTYIGVLSVSLDEQLVDPAALLLCVGEGLIVREELIEEEGLVVTA